MFHKLLHLAKLATANILGKLHVPVECVNLGERPFKASERDLETTNVASIRLLCFNL